jgi:hypothetical protein
LPEYTDPQVFAWGIRVDCADDDIIESGVRVHVIGGNNSDEYHADDDDDDEEEAEEAADDAEDDLDVLIPDSHRQLIRALHSLLHAIAEINDENEDIQDKVRVCVFFYDAYEQEILDRVLLAAATCDDDPEIRGFAEECVLTLSQGAGGLRMDVAGDTRATGKIQAFIDSKPFVRPQQYGGVPMQQVEQMMAANNTPFFRQCMTELGNGDARYRLTRQLASGRRWTIPACKKGLILEHKRIALGLPMNTTSEVVEAAFNNKRKEELDAQYQSRSELLRPRCAVIKNTGQCGLDNAAPLSETEHVCLV